MLHGIRLELHSVVMIARYVFPQDQQFVSCMDHAKMPVHLVAVKIDKCNDGREKYPAMTCRFFLGQGDPIEIRQFDVTVNVHGNADKSLTDPVLRFFLFWERVWVFDPSTTLSRDRRAQREAPMAPFHTVRRAKRPCCVPGREAP